MAVLETLRRRFTRDEYLKMAQAGVFQPWERVQLIAGEVVALTPQGSEHATTIMKVEVVLRPAFGPGYLIRLQFPLDLGPFSHPEPDVAVVAGSLEEYLRAHPTSALLVVEVSDTTLPLDRGAKAVVYAETRIPEYWIVNLVDRVLEVHRDPAPMPDRPGGHGYRTVFTLGPAQHLSPLAVPGATIAAQDLLP